MASIGSRVSKYGIRVIVISMVHMIFTIYDPSITASPIPVTLRDKIFYFAFLAYFLLCWQLGDLIYRFFYEKILKKYSVRRRNLFLVAIYGIYGLIVSYMYSFTYHLIHKFVEGPEFIWPGKVDYIFIPMNLGIIQFYYIICVILGYVYYYRDLKEEKILNEQLTKENLQAKYEVLKNQIDPHFFFNSLSVLSTLVYKDADLSSEYVTQLSKMYRYILDKGKKSLVRFDEELSFLESYLFLMKIRFDKSIQFRLEFMESTRENCFIPPNTLQMLAENAIKHNKFSTEEPLVIQIYEEGEKIFVKNNFMSRRLIEDSSKIGLENIKLRYELLGGKKIRVENTSDSFLVELPKYNLTEYESITI